MSEPKKQSVPLGEKILVAIFVLVFAGLLIVFAIPSFVNRPRTSVKTACMNNLRQIDGAKETWAIEHHAKTNAVVTITDISPLIKGGFPKCPSGGAYTIGRIGENPKCSVPGHGL